MDLKDTVHLPRTDFPMRADLAKREPVQIQAWTEGKLYDRLIAHNEGKPLFVLHDGPPYANGDLHAGHFLNKILKDFVVKFHALSGKQADFVPGWDCHGLPIELQVDKKLGPKKRELTPAQFRRECRKYAEEQVALQREQFRRLGVFARWDDPYLTMSFEYEAQTVRELAAITRRGGLYRRKRPVHWCGRDQTALAEAEVEYADKQSPSIYVKFEVVDAAPLLKTAGSLAGKKLGLVAWTTTPWTIPANLAIAAGPEIEYVAYDLGARGVVIVAKALLVPFLNDCAPDELHEGTSASELVEAAHGAARNKALKDHHKVLAHFLGEDLKGVTYRHPLVDRTSPVLLGAHATTEAGTGLVHTAPGHGEDDWRLGIANGLPVFAPVDNAGKYTKEVGDALADLVGLKVFDANPKVVEKLNAVGALMNSTGAAFEITHSYPHCWRCKQPVIFRATDQWWIGMDKELDFGGKSASVRKLALEAIETLAENKGWVPAWGRERIHGMVANRPDWCVSRQRSWGVPIPVAYCKACTEPLVSADAMEHVAGFFDKEGADAWFDRPLSELLPAGSKCKCGGTEFEKENDILDVWFDSGSSFAAVLQKGHWKNLRAPADLYLEGSDQHRGWFNSSLTIGLAAHGEAPYKQVLTHGFLVDEKGLKLSKSLGNIGSPKAMLEKYGADVVRLWVAASDYREDVRLGGIILDKVSEGYRKIRNTLRYCVSQLFDFDPATDAVPLEKLLPIDRWALSRLEKWRAQVSAAFETYEFHRIYHATLDLCAVDLSAVYFDSLKDRTYCSGKTWAERRAAQTAIHLIGETLTRMLAPMASFTAEETWAHFPKTAGRPDSVFLAGLPQARPELLNEALEAEFVHLLAFRTAVNARLEEQRTAKTLGKATEAEVELILSPDAMAGEAGAIAKKYEAQLADFLLCAKATLKTAPLEGKTVDATVQKSAHKPCERCFRALAEVGADAAHPTLCARCVRAIA
ncbi:MAG: isoleucine--tRNA ligase [Deltaproteobacteria bacterium]|nr:isoleucine--tRNA ligase [Deltaproteobacteria bacterium]